MLKKDYKIFHFENTVPVDHCLYFPNISAKSKMVYSKSAVLVSISAIKSLDHVYCR